MESFDIGKLANTGIPVEVNGRTLYARQISLRDMGRLQSVIRKIQPPPPKVEDIKKDFAGLPHETITELLKDARRQAAFWPAPVASSEGMNIILNNEDGQKELLKAALAKPNGLTDSDIDALMEEMPLLVFSKVMNIAITGDDSPADDPEA